MASDKKGGLIAAPYLKTIGTQGGTLYVFPSVSQDLTKTFVSNDYEFKFSHFACLNLPDFVSGSYSEDSDSDPDNDLAKGLYIETLYNLNNQTSSVTWTSDGLGRAIAENLQNYVMNFETAILNGMGDNDDYDNDVLTTVSEKVFFNWLRKIGGIQFDESGLIEKYNDYKERTVQYLGSIDVMNTVEVGADVFEELYIHIPSTVGASTKVYFRKGELTDDKNYLDKNYPISGTVDGVNKFDAENELIGKKNATYPTEYIPDGGRALSVKPLYDIDGSNIYVGDEGHTIDFRDSSYAGGDGISTMNGDSLDDFEFNAILIYYDLTKKTSTPGVYQTATNLYGILFLDNADVSGGRYRFQRYPKIKETVYGNGNSYALKVDFKVDTIPDSTYNRIPFEYNDANSVTSMVLYTKAIEQLQKCIDFFYTQKNDMVKLSDRIATLENLLMGIDTITSLKEDINRLYDMYDGALGVDNETLLGLIHENTKRLDTIMNGGKNLKLQYDTDVLQPGAGIGMVKTPNKVIISSEQKYSINTVIDGNSSNETEITPSNPLSTIAPSKICNLNLRPGENFAVIYLNDEGNSETDLKINIDDSDCNWVVGQSMKIYFSCDNGSLVFENGDSRGIVVKPTKTTMLSILGDEYRGNNLIEIVCVAENKFVYLIK